MCAKLKIPEEEILKEYFPPEGMDWKKHESAIDHSRSTFWEYRARLVDLYTRKGHLVKAQNVFGLRIYISNLQVDIELLQYRDREHQLYFTRCRQFDEHALPPYSYQPEEIGKTLQTSNGPDLLIDDVGVQYLGLTALSLLVTHENRNDISVELRRVGERGVGHPCVLIDLASKSFLAVFDESDKRLEKIEKERQHLVLCEIVAGTSCVLFKIDHEIIETV